MEAQGDGALSLEDAGRRDSGAAQDDVTAVQDDQHLVVLLQVDDIAYEDSGAVTDREPAQLTVGLLAGNHTYKH